jgi:hypothetical protein
MAADDASPADMTGPPADRVGARPPALDDHAVERLLAGDLDPASAPPGYGEVAALLAATLAEPSADELAGQAAAVTELRAVVRARPAGGNRPAGRPRRRTVLLAVAAVLGALSTAGVAAATDHVPPPVRQAARSILTAVGVAAPGTPAEQGRPPAPSQAAPDAAGARGQGAPASGGPRDRPGPAATGTAGAAGDGHCRAFLAGSGKADRGVVEALAAAAGGRDRIDAYCRARQPDGGKGQGRGAPPTTTGDYGNGNGSGSGGPPPGAGGGTKPGKGDPPGERGRGR